VFQFSLEEGLSIYRYIARASSSNDLEEVIGNCCK
jgi:hypothetical protein